MKIAVMGAGALGGLFGGRLAQVGHEVCLIARGAHLEALQRDGLRILSPKGDAHIKDIQATGDPHEVGFVDVRGLETSRRPTGIPRGIKRLTRNRRELSEEMETSVVGAHFQVPMSQAAGIKTNVAFTGKSQLGRHQALGEIARARDFDIHPHFRIKCCIS